MSVIRQIRLNPVTSLINIFQDFVEIVNDNTWRNLHVCRVALCREYNKRICERKHSMPVSELYAYSYMMRIYIDYFMVDECVRFLFTSCETLLRTSERSERVS